MFFDVKSQNLVATGRASNHSNPCGTNFYPGCVGRSDWGFPPSPVPPHPPPSPPASGPCLEWRPVNSSTTGRAISDCAAYIAGKAPTTPQHTVCDGNRVCAGNSCMDGTQPCGTKACLTKSACQQACSDSARCGAMQWQPFKNTSYTSGECWLYESCDKQSPYTHGKIVTSICIEAEECVRAKQALREATSTGEKDRAPAHCTAADCYVSV